VGPSSYKRRWVPIYTAEDWVGPKSHKRRWVPVHIEQETVWVPFHSEQKAGWAPGHTRDGGSHFTLSLRLGGSQFTLGLRLVVSQFTLIREGVGPRGRVDALRREQACKLYKDVLHRKIAIRLHCAHVNVISFTPVTNVQLCLRRFSRS
jgi:hypothetical protein